MNCDLLYNEEYIKLINLTIEESKLEYSIQIYNRNNIENIEDQIYPIHNLWQTLSRDAAFKIKTRNNKICFPTKNKDK